DRIEGLIGAEALLDVDDDQRGALAREQSHQAPTIVSMRSRWATEPAGTVTSTLHWSSRPAKQQFSERLSQPCSPATQRASRSTSATLAGAPRAMRETGRPNRPAPAVMRS